MKTPQEKTIEEVISILFSGQYYYNTDKWVELQSLLLTKMARSKDYSAVAIMMDRASKREHLQLIEFICSHLDEKWGRELWDDIKTLINSKSRDARYRGVFLHNFLAKNVDDYINIINCLNDEYQDVKLIAYRWMITHSDIVIDIITKEQLPERFSYFYQIYKDTSEMNVFEILNYSTKNYSSLDKKIVFFIFLSKQPPINIIKNEVDDLDDQDIFDYFYKYILND